MGRPVGRKVHIYDPTETPKLVYRLGLLGLTQDEIAVALGISPRTFTTWLREHPDLVAALADAGEKADAEVAAKLHERALGYDRPVKKVITDQSGRVHVHEYVEHFPADVRAAQYWLNNRSRARAARRAKMGLPTETTWSNREVHELTGENGEPINVNVADARERVASRIAGIASRIREGGDPSESQ